MAKRIWNGTDILESGEYARHPESGAWYCCSPNGLLGDLAMHAVAENSDGTISVQPSILITTKDKTWHGYLTNGVWIEC